MKLKAGLLPALFLAAGFCHAGKPEVLPVPPEAAAEIVANDMRYNGAPMRIVQFSTLDADETLKFYREHFVRYAKEGKYAEKSSNRRKMIGAMMQDKRIVNVEMTRKNKAAVHVLVSSLDIFQMEIPEKLAGDIPRMPGSKVVQHLDSRDGAKSNRFVIIQNNQSVESNAMYLREHYLKAGWRRDRDETIQLARHRQLGFSKDNRQLLVDVQKTGQECTVIHNEMTE
ncbi:MAG: hypothetical protein LBE85_09660 [Candidatus Accumulibacter sp.]|jgi:hypothetical protein|nr:hypothetical protein [Accumulibacter sp.]